MKISPTILNSSSALGSGSVSQWALGGGKGAGEAWGVGHTGEGATEISGKGIKGTSRLQREAGVFHGHLAIQMI